MEECKIPPRGWRCTRGAGHPPPCAALPYGPVQAGDVIVTEDNGWLSRAIRYFESRNAREKAAWASHAMIVAHNGLCVNATVPKVNKRPITCFPVYRAYRPRDPVMAYAIAASAEVFVGEYYGLFFLVLHAIGLRGFARYHGTPICSMVAGTALATTYDLEYFTIPGTTPGAPARQVRCDAAEPCDIEEWCLANPQHFDRVLDVQPEPA